MQAWLKISLLLCVLGFFKDFRPSEHFIYEFLIGPWRNISAIEIDQKVYPVTTYSYLAQLVLVFLLTDFLRYKPLIIILGISGIVIWAMLLWTKSLLDLQILEGVYGTYMATEVAYYTYIYAKVPSEYYQRVTSYVRAAILTGRFLSGVVGQLLISLEVMDFRELNYITFAAQIFVTIWAIFLPNVKKSIYFNQENGNSIREAFKLLFEHFKLSYTNIHVIKWSIWWAMATCGFIQVQSYMQPLWNQIEPNRDNAVYNGGVEAILTLAGTIAALLAGRMKIDWKIKGELLLTICSLIEGASLIIASQTGYVFVAYGCYVVFGSLYHFIITIVSAEVAKDIPEDTHGLVFGLNTLVALVLQTVFMIVVVQDTVFGLRPRDQFLVYGGYFIVIAVVYVIFGIFNWLKSRKEAQQNS